jgi:hypothetical protein
MACLFLDLATLSRCSKRKMVHRFTPQCAASSSNDQPKAALAILHCSGDRISLGMTFPLDRGPYCH